MKQITKWIFGDDNYLEPQEQFFIGLLFFIIAMFFLSAIVYVIYQWIYGIRDRKTSYLDRRSGKLIDKIYVGAHTSSGTGTTAMPTTNGSIGIGVTSTTHHSPEKWLFIIESKGIEKITVSMQEYYKYEVGDTMSYTHKIGGLSKDILSTYLNT